LELPVAAMDSNGTSLLLTLISVAPQLEVPVPLHLRYGEISHSNSETHRTAEIAWPDLILSCPSPVSKTFLALYDSAPTEFASSLKGSSLYVPFQTLDSDSDLDSSAPARFVVVAAPVGQYADVAQVRFGTAFTILAMFLYLAYVSWKTARRLGKRGKTE